MNSIYCETGHGKAAQFKICEKVTQKLRESHAKSRKVTQQHGELTYDEDGHDADYRSSNDKEYRDSDSQHHPDPSLTLGVGGVYHSTRPPSRRSHPCPWFICGSRYMGQLVQSALLVHIYPDCIYSSFILGLQNSPFYNITRLIYSDYVHILFNGLYFSKIFISTRGVDIEWI